MTVGAKDTTTSADVATLSAKDANMRAKYHEPGTTCLMTLAKAAKELGELRNLQNLEN